MNKRYRLKIKYPIPEKYKGELIELLHFDGQEVELGKAGRSAISSMSEYLCIVSKANVHEFSNCPKDWVKEVKDSEFDKLFDSVSSDVTVNDSRQFAETFWQASEKNRDLLYEGLLDNIHKVMGYPSNKDYDTEMIEEYARIRDILKDQS